MAKTTIREAQAGVPTAGTTGQVLTKNSNTNYDYGWAAAAGGQTSVQFQDEGANLGAPGTVDTLNFTGAGVTATRLGNIITANITGGGGGTSIGGAVTGGTDGSVLFVGAGPVLAQDNANFFWDDTNNRLGLRTATPSSVLHIVNSTTDESIVVAMTNAAAVGGLHISSINTEMEGSAFFDAQIQLTSTSPSPVNPTTFQMHKEHAGTAGTLAEMQFSGLDFSSTKVIFGMIQGRSNDLTPGSHRGSIEFRAATAGVVRRKLVVSGLINGVTVGDGITADGVLSSTGNFDLILQTGSATTGTFTIQNGANGDFLLMPNGTGMVGIGTATPDAKLDIVTTSATDFALRLDSSNNNDILLIENDNDSSFGPRFDIQHRRPTPTNNDILWDIIVRGNDSLLASTNYGQIRVRADSVASGSSQGQIELYAKNPGGGNTLFTVEGSVNGISVGSLGSAGIINGPILGIVHDLGLVPTQGRVGIGTSTPDASAILDLTSTIGALLLPRMTTGQRDALTPVNGMLIYNSTTAKLQGYEGGAWANLI